MEKNKMYVTNWAIVALMTVSVSLTWAVVQYHATSSHDNVKVIQIREGK